MGLSSCYWLYDIQHGVSHDVLTSQLEEYPRLKAPNRKPKIKINNNKKKKSDTPANNRGIDSTFCALFPIALLPLGSVSCLAAWRLKPILPSEAPPVSKTKTRNLPRVMVGYEKGE